MKDWSGEGVHVWGTSTELVTAWAMGLVAGIPWEIMAIQSWVVCLGAFTPSSPTSHQPLCRGNPSGGRGCVPMSSTGQGFPVMALGRCSMQIGGQDSPEPTPGLQGHVWPLGAQIQEAGAVWMAVSGLQRHPDQLLTHWLR